MSEEQKQNLANSVKKPNQTEVLNNLRSEFAQPATAIEPQEGKALLSFRSGEFYIGLKVANKLNPKTGKTEDVPQLTAAYGNGNFLNFPLSGEWWGEFSAFAANMSKALDGICKISVTNSGDADYAKMMMAQFKD
ncbi:MAG: hypothetical protein E7Z62_02880 [Thermoplasmata archaeon]|nr:hypothetical protein [Thermoplasmata archaeon]